MSQAAQRAVQREEAAKQLPRSVFVPGEVPRGRHRSTELHAEADEV